MPAKKDRQRNSVPTATPPLPEIVRLAHSIANTERAINHVVTRNVQLQVKLNETVTEESTLRKTLSGLQREMDRHTAGTRVH